MSISRIICGDCLQILPTLPKVRTIVGDPPDNRNLEYDGFVDRRDDYIEWLTNVIGLSLNTADVVWCSLDNRHVFDLCRELGEFATGWDVRQFIWRFTFGQHQEKDCGNGYRPILRFSKPGTVWNTDDIRVPSARQGRGDKRANPKGRVPDDVFEFPRVCGTFKERRKWHPTQHPEALIERIVRMSGGPVIDLFAGTFTVDRVCRRLGVDCTSIEISPYYCDQHEKESEGKGT